MYFLIKKKERDKQRYGDIEIYMYGILLMDKCNYIFQAGRASFMKISHTRMEMLQIILFIPHCSIKCKK